MKKLRYRRNGTVVVTPSITLASGQDDAVIHILEATANQGGLVADALRAYVDRFAGLVPEQRFRLRKDGRLVLHATLEFYPKRDEHLIRTIEAAPPEAVEWTLVELMRNSRQTVAGEPADAQPSAPEELDTTCLALEL